jgi:hypothetical protein
MALLAAVEDLRKDFFTPVVLKTVGPNGGLVENLVIGATKESPQLVLPTAPLIEYLQNGFEIGLGLNHHFKAQVVLVAELRSDTVTDLMLMGVMLRTLYELETLHCIGIVFVTRTESDNTMSPRLSDQSNKIRTLMDLCGLRFVPVVHTASSVEASLAIKKYYSEALPSGVTLVISAPLTAPTLFAEAEPDMFASKTARVILMSGAKRREHKTQWLEPDPDATNNRLDMAAATKFYKKSQELSVALVILSRFAARAGSVPRSMCDVLASHCGQIGRFTCDAQKACMSELWAQACAPAGHASRGSLPTRCDRHWFMDTFCAGKDPGSDDVWKYIVSFNAYSPLALLVALPGVVKRFVKATSVTVRAAQHQVIGWSADEACMPSPMALQKLLVHCLVYGARCNVSEYGLGESPPITLYDNGDVKEFTLDMSEESLLRMFPLHAAFASSSCADLGSV